jgi:hypothetical protein
MPVSVNNLKQFKKLVKHTRYREYMSGVDRDQQRIKATGEVFTPTKLVQEMLAQLPADVLPPSLFRKFEEFNKKLKEENTVTIDDILNKTFLDPTCGDGQFLSEVLIRKVKSLLRLGKDFDAAHTQALDTIYGVDLMEDNCFETIKRLHILINEEIKDIIIRHKSKMPKYHKQAPGLKFIFKLNNKILNIVCADGLKYDFSFGQPLNVDDLIGRKDIPKQPKKPKAKKPADNNLNNLIEDKT